MDGKQNFHKDFSGRFDYRSSFTRVSRFTGASSTKLPTFNQDPTREVIKVHPETPERSNPVMTPA